MNSPRPIEAATNPDLRHSWPALLRAAQRARQLAAQTGTAIVVVRDSVAALFRGRRLLPPQHLVEADRRGRRDVE